MVNRKINMERFLPPHLEASSLRACIGLVSDTHMPVRCAELPPSLFEVLSGVDLILHAGDVGELWALDRISAIAPVVAVHGNDDSADAQRELPYQQVITVAGVRILLWHSHYPDWDEEMASRQGDGFIAKLDRSFERARSAGASVAVFGHWHIPLAYRKEGILVVNPGAIASGNEITRQLRQTVALLFVDGAGGCHVTHIDLAQPDRPYDPGIDWSAGFAANAELYNASILAPELAELVPYVRSRLRREYMSAALPVILRLARQCWQGEKDVITREELLTALAEDNPLAVEAKNAMIAALQSPPNLAST
jgi:putative phosphoesterase